ncbi:MAG TPA: M1 family aminopeptidase [Candidatus Krumholzibacteria bacterium]|nr:M1 family aminopeptidase [Candidatus Krumholzibacteria bacterium]
MSQAPQSALERYKARRTGAEVGPLLLPREAAYRRAAPLWLKSAVLATGLLVLVLTVRTSLPPAGHAVDLAYEIDLASAPEGVLVVTVQVEGSLPPRLDLGFPSGVFGDAGNGVTPHSPTAEAPDGENGRPRPLPVEQTGNGWQVTTQRARSLTFRYQVDLARTRGREQDIRRYISTPVAGGLRAAGFEVFLAPEGVEVHDITVALRNPGELPVLVPWPALVRGRHAGAGHPDSLSAAPVATAHLGAGQGYLPAGPAPARSSPPSHDPTAVPGGLAYHPRNLRDLSNALLVCGDIRAAAVEVRDCTIQYATDRHWRFTDAEALDLVRRIARTQLGFFGSAPATPITVLLGANEVHGDGAFDLYGVHTGSSILVMADPALTLDELEGQAASVISHEMFHGWLGEAIPQTDPSTLWFTEGAATWFAARMLTAAGIWGPEATRDRLAERIERDYRRSDLLGRMSVAEAAAGVMSGGDQVRYAYAGGMAACAGLDAWLAAESGVEHPLDAVLRHLYEERDGSPLSRAAIETAVRDVTGVDCGWWLDAHVYGKTALPPSEGLI